VHGDAFVPAATLEAQAVALQRLDHLAPAMHQPDDVSRRGQSATEYATDAARTDDSDSHSVSMINSDRHWEARRG